MDELLQKDIGIVADERAQIFLMLDRFDKIIGDFSNRYGKLCGRQKQDLANRAAGSRSALGALSARHKKEKQDLQRACSAEILRLEKEIQNAEKQKQDCDVKAENRYRRWEDDYQKQIVREDGNDYRENCANDTLLQELLSLRNSVRKMLGDKLYDRITGGINPKKCQNEQEAREILRSYSSSKGVKTKEDIRKIHESLFLRLLFSGKRNELCCNLEETKEEVKYAVDLMRRNRSIRQAKRMDEFDRQKRGKRREAEQEKSAAKVRLDQIRNKCEQNILAVKKLYADRGTALDRQQRGDYQQKETVLKKEYSAADENWHKDRKKEQQNFQMAMETAFPAKRMYEMFCALWKHTVGYREKEFGTTPPKQGAAECNVPVGEVYVNVGRWYANESGAIVKNVLLRQYPVLFRQVMKNGKRTADPEYIRFPFTLSLEKGESLLVQCPDALQDPMEERLHAAAMRLLWAVPAGQSQFLLGDSGKIGSFADFVSLDPASYNIGGTSSYKSILDGSQVWDTAQEIAQRISDNRVRFNDIAGQMGRISSLREYNLTHPMNQRSYQITMIQKFPFSMNEQSLQSLGMLSADCGKWGYSSILSGSQTSFSELDPKLQPFLKRLAEKSLLLQMRDKNWFVVQGSPYRMERGSMVYLYSAPDGGTLAAMKQSLKDETEKAAFNKIYFEQAPELCPAKEQRFLEHADSGIVVPIGYLDGGEPCRIIFDDARVHAMVNGDTGGGKTNLLHILVTNILLRYPPEEVQIYLIDFKHGTEFRKYTNYNLPSFKAISVCNEPEFALQILQFVKKEMESRNRRFGNTVTSISGYNQTAKEHLPRILIILDELYELILESKASRTMSNVREDIMKLLKGFAIQARAYGIHMLISSQNLTEIPEMKSIRESCNTRIALRCSAAQAEALINKDASDRMRLISEKDQGACVVQLGKTGNPLVEHTAFLEPNHQHIRLLEEVHAHYCEKRQYGNARVLTTDVSVSPNNIYQRYLQYGDVSQVLPDHIWPGEKITMDAAEGMALKGKNLWIAGGITQEAEKAGKSFIFFSLLSLLLERKKQKNINLCLCSGGTSRGCPVDPDSPADEMSLVLKDQLRYATGDQMHQVLQFFYGILTERRNAGAAGTFPGIYLILVKPEEELPRNPQALQMLQEILIDGSAHGIQTILWTKEPQKLVQLQLQSLAFGEKILLEMESASYQSVLGGKPLVEPKDWHAVVGQGMRMRIYDLPEKAWVEKMILKLRS